MFTFYTKLTDKENESYTILDVLNLIKSDGLKYQTEICHKLAKDINGDKKKKDVYDLEKKKLPFITFCCAMKQNYTHSKDNLLDYSGYIILDWDHLTNPYIIKNALKKIPYTTLIFTSPSGNGLKNLVKITKLDLNKHKDDYWEKYFDQVKNYYEEAIFNITGERVSVDPSGKNKNRGCFIPYDKDVWENPRAKIFLFDDKKIKVIYESPKGNVELNDKGESTLYKIVKNIEENKIDIVDNYDEWIRVGFCIKKYCTKEVGRDFFHRISKLNNKYSKTECDKKFDNLYNAKSEKEISINYLFTLINKYKPNDATPIFFDKLDIELKKKEIFTIKDAKRLMQQDDWKVILCVIKGYRIVSWEGQKPFNLDSSGGWGNDVIRNYFLINYDLDLYKRSDIEFVVNSYGFQEVNFALDILKNNINSDGEEEFNKMCNYIVTEQDDEDKSILLKRFLLGVINNIERKNRKRKYDEMLILRSEKSIGKTQLIRDYLFSPFKSWNGIEYITESNNFYTTNKDLLFQDHCSIINYKAEVSNTIMKKPGVVKEYLSKSVINIRRSYRPNNEDILSHTTFIGDTNDKYYLPKDSNLRRFLELDILKLNFRFKDKEGKWIDNPINWQKMWGWLYYLYSNGKEYTDYEIPEIYSDNTNSVALDSDDSILRRIIMKGEENDFFQIDDIIIELNRNNIHLKDSSHEAIRVKLQNLGHKTESRWNKDTKKSTRTFYKGKINAMYINTPQGIPINFYS